MGCYYKCDRLQGLLPRFKSDVETFVSKDSTEVSSIELSNSVATSNQDEDSRKEKEKEEGENGLGKAISGRWLGSPDNVVDEQSNETK